MDVSGATGEINVWTNLSQSEMNFYVEEFNKRVPGVKVTVTVMPGNEYRTKLQNAFRTGTNAPDVATFEISDFGMYKNTDLLENLSTESYDAEALSKDMIPYVDELSRDDSGNLRGCPTRQLQADSGTKRPWQGNIWEQMIRKNYMRC